MTATLYERPSQMPDSTSISKRSPGRASRGTLLLLGAALAALALEAAVPVQAQPGEMRARPTEPSPQNLWIPLKVVSAEIQRLPREMSISANERAETVSEALVLKTAVSRRDLDRFTPARQPRLFLGQQTFPILRQESSNWDLREEAPIDPDAPVGEVEYLYFLIPRWEDLPEAAVPILAVRQPEQLPTVSEIETHVPRDEALEAIAGSVVFRHTMIVDRR